LSSFPDMSGFTRTVFLVSLIQLTGWGCTPDPGQASSFKTIFNHYRTGEEVIAVSLPPSLISIVMQQAGEENELLTLFRELSSFSLLAMEYGNTPEVIFEEFDSVLRSYTRNNDFNDMFFINNSGEEFYIKVREKEDHIREALIVFGGAESITAINLRGNIDPRLLTRLAEQGELLDLLNLELTGM
jgi:hypothetical protein